MTYHIPPSASHKLLHHQIYRTTYHALGVDVRDISSDTRRTLDIEERELADARVELEEEGERLANPAASTEDSDLGKLYQPIDY